MFEVILPGERSARPNIFLAAPHSRTDTARLVITRSIFGLSQGRRMQVTIHAVENVDAEFQPLLNEVASRAVLPHTFDNCEELLGVPFIDLGVQFVMHQFLARHPSAIDNSAANQSRYAREGLLDHSHTADTHFYVVEHARGRQHTVESPNFRTDDERIESCRIGT